MQLYNIKVPMYFEQGGVYMDTDMQILKDEGALENLLICGYV